MRLRKGSDPFVTLVLVVRLVVDVAQAPLVQLENFAPGLASAPSVAMPETMEISDAAKSGDGTTTNVGIKMTGTFQCPDCRQRFDSEKAKQLHWKFIHDPNRQGQQPHASS